MEYGAVYPSGGRYTGPLAHGGVDKGWVRDLAMLVQRAAVPPPRIEALATELENGVRTAGDEFTRRHKYGGELGARAAKVLGQDDDAEGQTRRMVMTVIANALVFMSPWQRPNS